MADKDTSGIERLRKLSRDVSPMPMWVCLRCGCEGDLGGYVNATVREVLNDLSDQIERERAEELAAAKRDLADEAREVVERLLKISPVVICTSTIASAVGVEQFDILDDCKCLELRDRLIELIEHGGKLDVDVAALRELADDMDKRAHGAYGKTFVNASMYAGLMHSLSKRIRKAVEGAKEPEVLGADGEPIREGETVWYDGEEYVVDRVYMARDGDYGELCCEIADLLRRQREHDAKTMGGE